MESVCVCVCVRVCVGVQCSASPPAAGGGERGLVGPVVFFIKEEGGG